MLLELTHPKYLIGLILIVILVWGFRSSLIDFSHFQRCFSLAVRILILILIVLALAGLTLMSPTQDAMTLFLLDQSRSVDAAAAEKAMQFLDEAQKWSREKLHIVPFGTADATNISAALEPALALVPPRFVPHLVLLSDGNETAGDVLTAAVQSGVTISTVPLPAAAAPEVQLAEIRTPPQIRQGEPFYLDIVVQSNIATEGIITLYKGLFKTVETKKKIEIGENVYRIRQTMDDRRQQEFSAAVAAKNDTILDNNRAAAILFAGGKPRVLIIDSEPKTCRDLASALREQDITAEIRPAEGVPRSLNELDDFEAVILSNVPATSMTSHQMNLLRTYVNDLGGGLMMLGSEQSFGLGGYSKTPVEEVLPVRCDFEKEKEKPSLAICLIIDRSGSMGGQKMELAKDAAKAAVELLSPKDFAAVIAFDTHSYVVCNMQSTASTGTILSAISTIEPAGGTNIYPALVDAYEQLQKVSAKLKHVILLTDGQSAPGDYDGIVRQMANALITVSTVGVGDADNELLKTIAENGKGRHYSCDDPKAIPQIFAKETITASKSAIRDKPFIPVIVFPTDVLATIDLDSAPPLLGYVVTKPKPMSQVILATESGDPLLVWRRYGLGMSAAFSSDAKSRWGAEWLTWTDYPKFWAQVIRQTMRKSDQLGTMLEIEQRPGGVHLTLDAVDEADRFENEAAGQTMVIRSDSGKEQVSLQPTAPGRYEADIVLRNETGERASASWNTKYHLQTTLKRGEKSLLNQSRGIVMGYPDELRLKPTNEELLQRLAESTDGLYNPKPNEIFEKKMSKTAWQATPLDVYLLTAAAFLFVFDVLLRRIEFGRHRNL
jgi:uncharacterized membrane protein